MSTTPQPGKPEEDASPPSSTKLIVSALKGLTQSTQSLLKNHIALAKHEAKADALEIGKDVTGLVIAGVFAALGYVLLLMSAVLFASWFAGWIGMALTCFALAVIHLVGGGAITLRLLDNFKNRHYGLVQTVREVETSKQWATESLKDEFTLPALPEPDRDPAQLTHEPKP